MATNKEIENTILTPLEHAGYKIPFMGKERENMIAVYKRVLGGYSAKQLEGAMDAALQTCTFTPKPADIKKALKDGSELDHGYVWVKSGTPEFEAWSKHEKWGWAAKQPKMLVASPFPPEEGEKK